MIGADEATPPASPRFASAAATTAKRDDEPEAGKKPSVTP